VTRNQRARGASKTRSAKQQAKDSANADRAAAKNADMLPIGGIAEHPHAAHERRVQALPFELESIIVDLGNAAKNIHTPAELFGAVPGVIERLQDLKATIDRALQGPHTAKGEKPTPPVGLGSGAQATAPAEGSRSFTTVGGDPKSVRTKTYRTAEPAVSEPPGPGPSATPAAGEAGASVPE